MAHRPSHLSEKYGQQFGDQCVVNAYHARPPYPDELIDELVASMAEEPRPVLELGCGTGDLTVGLAARVAHVDAVEPAGAMLVVARRRCDSSGERVGQTVRFIQSTAEDFPYADSYSLVVAAESIHWMRWESVLPKIAGSLVSGGQLALVTNRTLSGLPWQSDLNGLLSRYSTNQEYRPYDIVDELSARKLFAETRRLTTKPVAFSQSVSDYILSFHSRNGFSVERMGSERAAECDAAVAELVAPHVRDGVVRATLTATVVWGHPSDPGT